MIPSSPNAFLGSYPTPDGHPRGSLAGMLALMRATLEPTGYGHRLSLQPLRFMDVAPLWGEFGDDEATTLLVDHGSDHPREHASAVALAPLAAKAGIETIDAFGDDAVAIDDEAFDSLVQFAAGRRLAAVRVDGPIEPRDAEAMIKALARGDSALEFECRASAALYMTGTRSLRLDVRDRGCALLAVAESFRHYVAALRNRSVTDVAAPEAWQMQRLLDIAGEISVRPIETEVFTTSIDVGICTEAGGPTKPAGHSLIYDVYSDTWHDEP